MVKGFLRSENFSYLKYLTRGPMAVINSFGFIFHRIINNYTISQLYKY